LYRQRTAAKQSQFRVRPRGMGPGGHGTRRVVQTNPICRPDRAGHGLGDEGHGMLHKQTQFATDEPGRPSPRPGLEAATWARGKCAKQSQFMPSGQTEPFRDRLYKQDAHDKSPRVGFGPAFLGRYRGLVPSILTFVGRVKQTQFAAVPPKIGVFATRRRKKSGGDAQPTKSRRRDSLYKQSQFPRLGE
jgi:hypothetical protein